MWQVRKRVPDEIRHVIGKTEITRSLGTGDLKAAKERYWEVSAEIEKQFAHARRSLTPSEPRLITKLMARDFAANWYLPKIEASIETALNSRGDGDLRDWLLQLDEEEEHLISGPDEEVLPSLQSQCDEILIANGFPELSGNDARRRSQQANVDKASDGYWALVDFVRRGEVEQIRRQRDALSGEPIDKRYDPVFSPQADLSNLNNSSTSGRISVDELIEKYLAADDNRTERMKMDLQAAMRPLRETVGDQYPANDLSFDDFQRVLKLLKRMPTNANKGKRRVGKTLEEISKEAELLSERTLSAVTVNKYMARISAMMQWALDVGFVDKNLAKSNYLRAAKNKASSDKDAKEAFSYADLNTIFLSEKFTNPSVDQPSFYWVPLLSLFHGMRMGEILQLVDSDLHVEDGVSYLQLHDEGENHLKNSNARRRIPLHPEMSYFHFDTLIAKAANNKGRRLFPDVPRGSEGKFSSIFTQRYSRHLKKIGAKQGKVSFHSFRHTWRDACRNNKVPDDRVCSIGGWEHGSGTQTIYGSGIALKELAKAIRMIDYPDIDFSKIKVIDWNV